MQGATHDAATLAFDAADAIAWLDAADGATLDLLPYGVIRMDRHGMVTHYNRTESLVAGLSPERVMGRHFFTTVAPCANNALVAFRFNAEPSLDATIDYVFTLRLRPTPVRLRMLRVPEGRHAYLLVHRL